MARDGPFCAEPDLANTPPDKPRVPGNERRNSIGLDDRGLADLLDKMDAHEAAPAPARRAHSRHHFRRSALRIALLGPDGAPLPLVVACRNLSRGGISILHNAFIHPGTRCLIMIPAAAGGEVPVQASVARCSHCAGLVHEVGLHFADPLDLHDFLRLDPLSDWMTIERVSAADLAGSLLCVSADDADARIIRHFLRGSRLAISTVSTAALAIAAPPADLVITDESLPDASAAELIAALRARGHTGPVLVTAPAPDLTRRDDLSAVPASAFLAKPLDQQLLLRAVAELLPGPAARAA
jgi:CheY-like chemotaxis protein